VNLQTQKTFITFYWNCSGAFKLFIIFKTKMFFMKSYSCAVRTCCIFQTVHLLEWL